MKTIEKFMCFKLKTGAYIVAVFCMIYALLLLYLNFCSLSTLKTDAYEAIRSYGAFKMMNYEEKQILYDITDKTIEIVRCIYMFELLAATVMIVINGIFIFGLNTHDVKLMIPGVVICAFSIIMFPLNILLDDVSAFGLFKAIIVGIIFYFCFLTLYSAYAKVRDGKPTTATDQQESNYPATNP